MAPLIGVSGKAGSGKDSIGEILALRYGFDCISFAGPLKAVVGSIFSLDTEQLYNNKEAVDVRWGLSPRQILQAVGLKMREIHPDVWLRLAEAKIRKAKLGAVVTDVRFLNEVQLVKRLGGEVWRVRRPKEGSASGSKHISETELDLVQFDVTIDNSKSMKSLIKSVLALAGERGWASLK
jgi:hypothetical protein